MAYINARAPFTRQTLKRSGMIAQAALLAFAMLVPFLISGSTSAAQMTNRSATIDNSNIHNGTTLINTDVEFLFGYDLIDTAATKAGIIYEFCDNPLGTCTLPTGMDVQTSNVHDAQTGFPDNANAFAASTEAADVGDCTNNTNAYMLCYERDEAVSTGTTGGAVTHTISGIQAPSAEQTVYIRISVYSNDDFLTGNLLDTGTVAVAFVDQLTINGRVQERLQFCVQALGDADAEPTSVANCAAIGDTDVDLGIVDESGIAITPVETTATNGSDDDYGILMLNTNATAGASISYYPTADAGGTEQLGAFRVDNATCNVSAATLTDQCFQSASNAGSGTDISGAATEGFGLTIACIDTSQGTTTALGSVPDYYNGDDDDTSNLADCDTADAANVEFGWNSSTTTADTLTSSASVVDDEIVKILFGAKAAPTTPSGEYTVTTNYIATVTF